MAALVKITGDNQSYRLLSLMRHIPDIATTVRESFIQLPPDIVTDDREENLAPEDREKIGRALRDARAPNTWRAYRGAWRRWAAWAADRGHRPLPADPAAVAAFLAGRAEHGAAPATVRLDRAGIAAAHRHAGLADPTTAPGCRAVLAGIARRGAGAGRGQAAAMDWRAADLAAALAAREGTAAGLRDAALLALMSDALLRVGEAAAANVADVARTAGGSGTLTVPRSKTDQEGRGHVRYLGAATVARVAAWLDRAGHHDGALFRRVRRGGHPAPARLSAAAVREIVKRRAADAGVPGRVSGHSLRVGSAQSLAAAGAGEAELREAGDWTDPAMPARYTRHQAAARGAVARLRYGDAGS